MNLIDRIITLVFYGSVIFTLFLISDVYKKIEKLERAEESKFVIIVYDDNKNPVIFKIPDDYASGGVFRFLDGTEIKLED